MPDMSDRLKWCKMECWKKKDSIAHLKIKVKTLKASISETQQNTFSSEDLAEVDYESLKTDLNTQISLNDKAESEILYFRQEKLKKLNDLEQNNSKLREAIAGIKLLVDAEVDRKVAVR